MQDLNELLDEVERTPSGASQTPKSDLFTAIQAYKTQEMLFFRAVRGSAEDREEISNILQQDPRRYICDLPDARSLVNLKSPQGRTLLYEAAVHGHAQLIPLLLSQGADCHQGISLGSGEEETALAGASRWSHISTVEALLTAGNWSIKELKSARRGTKSLDVRKRLDAELRKKRSRSFLCF